MFAKSTLLTACMAAAIDAASLPASNSTPPAGASIQPGCSVEASAEFMAFTRELAQNSTNKPSADLNADAAEPVEVKVYVHLIASNEEGLTSNETVQAQMKALNDAFASARMSFKLEGVDKNVNQTWDQAEDTIGMQRQLRKGDYGDLNLYFASLARKPGPRDPPGTITGGICTLPVPSPATEGSTQLIQDGCIMSTVVLPGESNRPYHQGKKTVHEVGHWMGLLHTFEGGCDETGGGDMIFDTPAQANATFDCPASRDSCPGKEGQDPFHNYMDYSPDECLSEFTPGQIERMHQMFQEIRKSQSSGGNPQPVDPDQQEGGEQPEGTDETEGEGDGQDGEDPDQQQPQPDPVTSFGPERTVYPNPEDEQREKDFDSNKDIDDILRQVEEQERERERANSR